MVLYQNIYQLTEIFIFDEISIFDHNFDFWQRSTDLTKSRSTEVEVSEPK